MFDARNNSVFFEAVPPGLHRRMPERKTKGRVLGLLAAVIISGALSGCGTPGELFILGYTVYPANLNVTAIGALRTREIERCQFQYEDIGWSRRTRTDSDGIADWEIPLLIWRFGD